MLLVEVCWCLNQQSQRPSGGRGCSFAMLRKDSEALFPSLAYETSQFRATFRAYSHWGMPPGLILRHCTAENSVFPVFPRECSDARFKSKESVRATNGLDDMAKLGHFWFRMLALLLACLATFQTIPLTADQVLV